jgi:hypothetical protein
MSRCGAPEAYRLMTTQVYQRQTTGEMASQEQWQEHGTGAMLHEQRQEPLSCNKCLLSWRPRYP